MKNLSRYKKDIDPCLQDFFNKKLDEYSDLYPFAKLFLEHLAEFTLRGGKRLRPALMYYTHRMFSNENLAEIKNLSIYLELIQSFLLIHDDIMDRAFLRRDGRTMHKIFESYSQKNGYLDDIHFGNTMGILSGDLACLMAYEIINEANIDPKIKTRLNLIVSNEISKVIFGQIQDVLLTYKTEYTQEDILSVHHYKTAVYTFKLPVFSGAVLNNISDERLNLLEKYATSCGIAFQIKDDILGVFGENKKLGKGTKSDIIEGKKTLLVLHAYAKADEKQKKVLDNALGNRNLTNKQAEKFRQIVEETGSLSYSTQECSKYVEKAKSALKSLNIDKNEGYDFLNSLAEYLLVRDY